MVMKTTDGGAHWNNFMDHGSYALYGVHFQDPTVGYAVGDYGRIIKTTDCGATWVGQNSSIFGDLSGVYFTDVNTGYVTATMGRILKTTDGGTTWNPLNTGTFYDLLSVEFTSPTTGYAGGRYGTVLKTTDAGATWSTGTGRCGLELVQCDLPGCQPRLFCDRRRHDRPDERRGDHMGGRHPPRWNAVRNSFPDHRHGVYRGL